MSTEPEETRSAYDQLKPRMRRFVDGIVAGKSQTDAAAASGFKGKRPEIAGCKWMRLPMVAKAVEQRRMQAAVDAGVEASAVLTRIVAIATSTTAKDADKLKADELLGKHLKLFTEKHEHAGKDGAPLPSPVAAPVILMTPEASKAIAEALLAGV